PVTFATSGPALLDNLTVRPVAAKVTKMVPVPQPGRTIATYDFSDGYGPGWSWLREDPAASVPDGKVRWPVGSTDLVGRNNNSPLLLHDAPAGDSWMVETKLHLELGENDTPNYSRPGLIVYNGADDFARLGPASVSGTRQTGGGARL